MNLSKLSEPFPEDEIEWRIGQCGKNGRGVWASCLAYVTSRAIQDRLDAVCGPEGWQVSYRFVPGSADVTPGVIGVISIWVGDRWVSKEDGAEQTDIESFKGGLSSALKRAGSAWGIGRYLYSLKGGYAQIVESGTADSLWGKTKDGTEFHWVPPKLPKWALPTQPAPETGKALVKPNSSEDARPIARGISPSQPSVEDGGPVDGYRVTFGQWRKRSIKDLFNDPNVGPAGVASYIQFLENPKQVAGRKAEQVPLVEEFIEIASDAIAAYENGVMPS